MKHERKKDAKKQTQDRKAQRQMTKASRFSSWARTDKLYQE